MKNQLILVGAGGHAKACIDVIEHLENYSIYGLLTPDENIQEVAGYPVIGNDDFIPDLIKSGFSFLMTIGQIKNADSRSSIYEGLVSRNANIAIIKSPWAYISKHAHVGFGSIIMHGAVLNIEASIGQNCIINTNATVEHETTVGSNTHISTNAVVNGGCKIGSKVFIGSGSVIHHQINIADNVVIAAGSVVTKDIKKPGVYAGSPLKQLS